MWFKSLFEGVSRQIITNRLREGGTFVGERLRNGRRIYVYLLKDVFVQVVYKNDDPIEEVERLETFTDIDRFNLHLEQEFRAAF